MPPTTDRIQVQPTAVTTMALHAMKHPYESCHGFLLGTRQESSITVQAAVPVTHGPPNLVQIEVAQKFLSNQSIIGWYTAPQLASDTKAGPVALRVASSLATDETEPVLLVVQNESLDGKVASMLQGYGRNFGNQWLESISTQVIEPEKAAKAIQQQANANPAVDLLDHYQDNSLVWYPQD